MADSRNLRRPWSASAAVLQLAHDIDPYKRIQKPSLSLQYVAAEELRARAACLRPGASQEPMFWYRPRSDGGYEGPLHAIQIDEVRKGSGVWIPLFAGAAPAAQAVGKA